MIPLGWPPAKLPGYHLLLCPSRDVLGGAGAGQPLCIIMSLNCICLYFNEFIHSLQKFEVLQRRKLEVSYFLNLT